MAGIFFTVISFEQSVTLKLDMYLESLSKKES